MLHVSTTSTYPCTNHTHFRSQRMFCSFVFFKNQDDCASVLFLIVLSEVIDISISYVLHTRTCSTSSRRWLAVSKIASSPKVSTSTDVVVGSRQQSKRHVRISSR